MGLPSQTALDRFLNTRAGALVGQTSDRALARGFPLVAAFETLMGTILLIGGAFDGEPVAVIMGALFVLVGIAAYGFARHLKRKVSATETPDLRVTPEAIALLQALFSGRDAWPLRGTKTCRDLLAPEAFGLLESAAFQYNRIQGSLAAATPNPTLARLSPSIRAASDESMADLLHVAALVNQYPESSASHANRAAAHVEELRQLADHVERLQAAEAQMDAHPISRIQDVLQALQEDQTARSELGLPASQIAASPEQELRYGGN